MSQSANVTSVEAVKDLRQAMVKFCETVEAGLCANEMESRRMYYWLTSEQPNHWAHELRERQEELVQAQTDLHRLKLQRAQGMTVDDIQQKKMVERAKARVEEAEEKLEKVQHWSRVVQRAIDEYESHARALSDLVEGNPPQSIVFLDRVIASLDAYMELTAPQHRETPATASTSPAAPATDAAKPT